MDEQALAEVFSVETGVFSIAAILGLVSWRIWNGLPHVMAQWIAWRVAKDAAKGADWNRLRSEIDKLWTECRELRQAVQDCENREVEWMHRAIAAEAKLLGRGEAMQDAQRIVSAEREIDARKRGDK